MLALPHAQQGNALLQLELEGTLVSQPGGVAPPPQEFQRQLGANADGINITEFSDVPLRQFDRNGASLRPIGVIPAIEHALQRIRVYGQHHPGYIGNRLLLKRRGILLRHRHPVPNKRKHRQNYRRAKHNPVHPHHQPHIHSPLLIHSARIFEQASPIRLLSSLSGIGLDFETRIA